MSRPYHGRRRRRPGRRLRYRGGRLPARASYQGFGMRMFYDLLLPHVRGRARQRFFNGVSGLLALYVGVIGAVLGFGMLGPFGVFLGFAAGIGLGGNALVRSGYYRR